MSNNKNNLCAIKEIKQIFVKSPYIFELRKKTIKKLEEKEILLKIKAIGICGTDVAIAKEGAPDFTPLGHEISGTVEEVGASVTEYRPGDKVVAENHTMCGVCSSCKNGQPIYCKNIKYYYGIDAGLADYIVLHCSMLNSFKKLSFEKAAIAEPLTVALDLVASTDISLNSDVAVFGTGTIGLLTVQLLKLKGARSIMLVGSGSNKNRSKFKCGIGKKLGADFYANYNDYDFYKVVNDKYPEGVDRILITSPPQTFLGAIKIAKFGGIIGLIGIALGKGRNVTFDMNEFHFKRLQLRCVHPLPNLMFPLAIDLLEDDKIKTDNIITHIYKFEEYKKAFELLKDSNQNAIKVIIKN